MKSNKTSKRHIEHLTCIKTLVEQELLTFPEYLSSRQELLTFPKYLSSSRELLTFPEYLSSRQELLTFPEYPSSRQELLTFPEYLSSRQELLTFPPEFTPGILCGACSSMFCGLLCKSLFVLLFSLSTCLPIYGFWLPLRYPLTFLSNT